MTTKIELSPTAWADLGTGPITIEPIDSGAFLYVAGPSLPANASEVARTSLRGGSFGDSGSRVYARARGATLSVFVSQAPRLPVEVKNDLGSPVPISEAPVQGFLPITTPGRGWGCNVINPGWVLVTAEDDSTVAKYLLGLGNYEYADRVKNVVPHPSKTPAADLDGVYGRR